MSRHSRSRRLATMLALAAALALGACAADSTGAIGTPTADAASPSAPEPPPTAEPTPSETPTASDSPDPIDDGGLVNAVDLCEELDLRTLSDVTGMPFQAGTFDGAMCTWQAKDELGTLVMSLGEAERTAAYIEEVQDLDIGEEVDVTGADDAAAVTIMSGSGADRNTRVALAAKVGRQRLTVILIGKNANLETAVELAELVANA
jgi:hypothetical protein